MIVSTGNAQVRKLVQLKKKAKLRREEGLFLVEGIKMFQEAPKDWVKAIYVSATFFNNVAHQKMLKGRTYELLSDEVFAYVSDTRTPQGILCVVKIPVYSEADFYRNDGNGKRAFVLVLENIQDPGNLGTMIRTGEGAGITGVLMDQTTADLFNPKTIRSTMGSIYRVPFFVTDDMKASLDCLKYNGVKVFAAHLEGSRDYTKVDYTSSAALMIGNEGNGLTKEMADQADAWVRIPMEGQVESLNAAIAAALLMYEVSRQNR